MQGSAHTRGRGVGRYAIEVACFAALYYLAARFSLRLSLVEDNVTPFWPPTGIALAGFVLFGRRLWPAVAIGAFLVNLEISPPLTAAEIAIGNTLAPLAASFVLTTLGFRRQLDRLRDAFVLVFFAALPSTLISASIGTAALISADAISTDAFFPTWSVWWTGDAMGMLAVAPAILVYRDHRVRLRLTPREFAEALILAVSFIAAVTLPFYSSRPLYFAVFPPLAWISWRYQLRGAAPAALLVSTVATLHVVRDQGPFATLDLFDKMIGLQSFNAAACFTALFLAASVAERIAVEDERHELAEREQRAQAELYERERRVTETFQRSLLPDTLPFAPDLEMAARYVPSSAEVGGDWYDVMPIPDGTLAS